MTTKHHAHNRHIDNVQAPRAHNGRWSSKSMHAYRLRPTLFKIKLPACTQSIKLTLQSIFNGIFHFKLNTFLLRRKRLEVPFGAELSSHLSSNIFRRYWKSFDVFHSIFQILWIFFCELSTDRVLKPISFSSKTFCQEKQVWPIDECWHQHSASNKTKEMPFYFSTMGAICLGVPNHILPSNSLHIKDYIDNVFDVNEMKVNCMLLLCELGVTENIYACMNWTPQITHLMVYSTIRCTEWKWYLSSLVLYYIYYQWD